MDTYKVATTANSCSTMHTITKKPLTMDLISHDHLDENNTQTMQMIMTVLENLRQQYLAETDPEMKKLVWYNIIQMLPSSWNQMRTVTMDYETLYGIIKFRRHHKLEEWHTFCEDVIENCPYIKELVLDIIDAEEAAENKTEPASKIKELESKSKYLETLVKVYHAKYGTLSQEMIDEVLHPNKEDNTEEATDEGADKGTIMEQVVAVESLSAKRKAELTHEITEKLKAAQQTENATEEQ